MQISQDAVVRFHYTLSDDSGTELENSRSDAGEPMTYLHGHGGLLAGLEKALEGKAPGDSLSVTLAPAEAFGERQDDSLQRVPIKHLSGAKKWQPGMVATINTQHGQRQVLVAKVGHTMATVDTNHPLAGKTLTFDMTVEDVRSASSEELSHGHAHGPGGHQH